MHAKHKDWTLLYSDLYGNIYNQSFPEAIKFVL